MSDPTQQPVYNYTPPGSVNTNRDAGQLADVAKLVEQLRALGVNVPEPAEVLTPEQQARKAIDAHGFGLGVGEQLAELYRHLDTIAQKVGI